MIAVVLWFLIFIPGAAYRTWRLIRAHRRRDIVAASGIDGDKLFMADINVQRHWMRLGVKAFAILAGIVVAIPFNHPEVERWATQAALILMAAVMVFPDMWMDHRVDGRIDDTIRATETRSVGPLA